MLIEIREERAYDLAIAPPVTVLGCYNSVRMLHRHLNHSEWTLAAIDDVIARGKLDDWKELRDAAKSQTEIRDKILRVATPHLPIPTHNAITSGTFMSQRNLPEWK